MKKKSLELSREEKDKRMAKRGRQVRRKILAPKSTSTNTLYRKIGKLKDRFQEFEKKIEESRILMEDSIALLLERMEKLSALPIIKKAIIEQFEAQKLAEEEAKKNEGKEECPTCHKYYKQLKKHTKHCKGKV